MDERNMWIDIITKLYKDLHTSDRVMHSSKESDKKRDRILNYFDRLERVHQKVAQSKNPEDLKILEKFYHNLYVIKPENIPDSYFEHEKQIMRERGYGDIEITPQRKEILVKQIIEDQEESLDKWIEYFLFDEESKSYEMWEKYWVFQGLQQLGKFNKETGKFSKRDKHTVYPFPPVEKEAIFTTLKLMEDYIKNRKGDDEIRSALGSGNFKTLYEYSIKMIMNKGDKKNNSTEGEWVKYEQGSDYHILRDSLQGYYTGWCTAAGENFAKGQLKNGDFYVYYTLDENGEAKVPRIAIRMDGHDTIGEIRGIAENQNMEPEMMPILDKKLEEFPDRDKYKKKEYDMQFLTTIDNKLQKGFELNIEELRFLYELDDEIEGFGWQKDPRIEEIKSKRNVVKDLNMIFEDVESIKGNLDLSGLTSAEGLKFPGIIEGNLDLSGLTSAEDLILPEQVGGALYLTSLTTAKGLKLPEKIGMSLNLSSLTSAEGLIFPQTVGWNLNLSSLRSAERLIFPQTVGGSLDLSGLISAEGLKLPEKIGKELNLSSLKNVERLIFPQTVGWNLNLSSLRSAERLIFPQTVGGSLDLSGLISAKELTLPQTVVWDLNLNSLKNVEKLIFPQTVGGFLNLRSLTTAKGLKLPEKIGMSLNLRSLTSAKGLKLPQTIEGFLDLSSLKSVKGLKLPEKIGMDVDLRSLRSAKGLALLQTVELFINLKSLRGVKGLVLSKSFPLYKLRVPKKIQNRLEKYFRDEDLNNDEKKYSDDFAHIRRR